MVEPVPVRVLWIGAGFMLWSTTLTSLYAIQAIGCAYDWSPIFLRVVLGIVFVAHLVAIGLLIANAPRKPDRSFLVSVTIFTLWAALISTVLTFGPALVLSTCI